jgi:hypothetical protein
MGRTRIGAEVAVTAEGHVDVELSDAQLDGSSIGREDGRLLFGAPLRGHVNAVHRTSPNTLATTDTVLDLVEQSHPRAFREFPFDTGILQGAGAGEEMEPRNLHSQQDRPDRLKDIQEITFHGNPFESVRVHPR